MLISFGDTLTDTPRNNVLPVIWPSLNPLKLTHKVVITDLGLANSWGRTICKDKVQGDGGWGQGEFTHSA